MPTFTVTEIVAAKPWTPAGETEPKKIYYDVKIEGQERPVQVGRNPGNPLTAGAVLEGTIGPDDRGGQKFTLSNNGFKGGGRGGKSIEERRGIAMQASHKVAVDVVRIAVDAGLWKPETPKGVAAAVQAIATDLYAQVNEVSA